MKPNCIQCKHYFITFNQSTPKGCRAYGIQSAQLPSIVVKNATSGNGCLAFELKQRLVKKKTKDLNDPKLW